MLYSDKKYKIGEWQEKVHTQNTHAPCLDVTNIRIAQTKYRHLQLLKQMQNFRTRGSEILFTNNKSQNNKNPFLQACGHAHLKCLNTHPCQTFKLSTDKQVEDLTCGSYLITNKHSSLKIR